MARVLRQAGLNVSVEPTNCFADTFERPDLEVIVSWCRLLLDMCICVPLAKHSRPLAAAAQWEKAKFTKYGSSEIIGRGEFFPFVIEIHGAFGEQAQQVIKRLAQLGDENTGLFGIKLLRTLVAHISMQVHRGNALVVLRATGKRQVHDLYAARRAARAAARSTEAGVRLVPPSSPPPSPSVPATATATPTAGSRRSSSSSVAVRGRSRLRHPQGPSVGDDDEDDTLSVPSNSDSDEDLDA